MDNPWLQSNSQTEKVMHPSTVIEAIQYNCKVIMIADEFKNLQYVIMIKHVQETYL